MDVIASSVCKAMYFKGDPQFKKGPEPKARTKKTQTKPKHPTKNKPKICLIIFNFPIL